MAYSWDSRLSGSIRRLHDPTPLSMELSYRESIHPLRSWGLALITASLAGGAAVLALHWGLQLSHIGIDDAYIFAVYARHWAEGKGLVYNPGERPVEGFTSPLWLLITTMLYKAGFPWETGALSASLAFFILLLAWTLHGIGGSRWWRSPSALFMGAWLLSIPGFVAWNTLTLMDTILLSFGVTAISLALWNGISEPLAGLFIVFLILTRPEGMAWALAWIGLDALRTYLLRDRSRLWSRTLRLLLVYMIAITVLTAWRLHTFGDFLPNTYYAKRIPPFEAFKSGFIYLLLFVLTYPVGACASLLGGYTVLRRIPEITYKLRSPSPSDPEFTDLIRLLLLTSLAGVGLVLPLLTGDDHFPMFRFYQPIWPSLGLLLLLIGRLQVRRMSFPCKAPLFPQAIAPLLPVLFSFLGQDHYAALCCSYHAQKMKFEIDLAAQGRSLAQKMNKIFDPMHPEVAIIAAGGFRFEYRGKVFDLMGLNDREMARAERWHPSGFPGHVAFRPEVFLRRVPPVVLPYDDTMGHGLNLLIRGFEFNNSVLKGLLTSGEFHLRYRLVRIQRSGEAIIAFVERSFADRIAATGFAVEEIEWLPPR